MLARPAAGAIVSDQLHRTIQNVQGMFSWNQEASVDNETLAKSLYRDPAYLCGAQGVAVEGFGSADIKSIRVTGDVGNAFTASVEDFAKKAPAQKVMGCTCAGNPADGLASANADVAGFKLAALVQECRPQEGANTITFTSADGYQVALPLAYVMQRYSLIVTAVNGDPASSAIGCSNQLWLGSTAARSFARDVVEISITKEAEPPAAPGASAQANMPNVGVTAGAAIA